MYPFKARIRRLLLAALVACLPALVQGAAITSQESGVWNDTDTWTGGVVPTGSDTVTIPGHHVIVMNTGKAASSVTITSGGTWAIGDGVTPISFALGGGGVGLPSMDCTDGSMVMTGNATLTIDPDDPMTTRLDGLTFQASSCAPMLRGRLLYSGIVDTVTFDDSANEIVFIDRGLAEVTTDFPVEALVVWRDSAPMRISSRKSSWFDLTCSGTCISATNSLELDFDSRHNDARIGPIDATTGTSSVSGTVVTYATGPTWDNTTVLGGLWWCTADGVGSAQRIRELTSATVIVLEATYTGGGCGTAAASTIRDENAPWPRLDMSEHIEPGDRYDVILPWTVKSLNASDSVKTEQIFIDIEEGNPGIVEYGTLEGAGHGSFPNTTGQKQQGSAFYWNAPDENSIFNTVEVTLFEGLSAIQMNDAINTTVQSAWVHWSHPLTSSNHGHGIVFIDTITAPLMKCNAVRDSRVDRINDDAIFFSGASSVCDTTGNPSIIADNIVKYVPMVLDGSSCSGVDTGNGTVTAGEAGVTSTIGGHLVIERNLFANFGCLGSTQMVVAYNNFSEITTEWTPGFVARDNFIANAQTGYAFDTVSNPNTFNSQKRKTIWFLNNYVTHMAIGSGGQGASRLYQNVIVNTPANHGGVGGGNCVRQSYIVRSNICVGPVVDRATDAFSPGFNVHLIGGEPDHGDTSPIITDNVTFTEGAGLQISEYSGAGQISTGALLVEHNAFLAHPRTTNFTTNRTNIVCDFTTETTGSTDPIFRNNIFSAPYSGDGKSAVCSNGCLATTIVSNAWSSGQLTEAATFDTCATGANNLEVAGSSSGLDARGSSSTGAGGVTSTDSDEIGPRFAGILWHRLPWPKPYDLPPNVVQGTNARDTDGDGLIDLWDNCDATRNPGWLDTDDDGIGDACE